MRGPDSLSELTRKIILLGDTEPWGSKTTANNVSFQGSFTNICSGREDGVFTTPLCPSSPVFGISSLVLNTVESGWLSFSAPLHNATTLVYPNNNATDKRVEVICSRAKTHLGHFFDDPKVPIYCINAAALNFIPFQFPSFLSTLIVEGSDADRWFAEHGHGTHGVEDIEGVDLPREATRKETEAVLTYFYK